MEPSFVATPYMQVSTLSSAEIRAMLDQQEALYLEWRRARKNVRHPFASQKLNSVCRLAPVTVGRSLEGRPSPSSPVQAVRLKFSLGPVGSTEILGHGKRKDAIQLGLGLPSTASSASLHELPRLSLAAPETGPELDFESTGGAAGGRSRKQSVMVITRRPTATIATPGPSVPANASDETSSRTVRVPRAAYKYLEPYLHDYYTRQVFSFASSDQDEARGEDSLNADDADGSDEATRLQESVAESASMPVNPTRTTEEPSSRDELVSDDYVVAGLELVPQRIYDAIFELDWQSSAVDKTVRDAVDRKRIAGIVRSGYRVLLCFFRYYAGNAAVNSASASASGSTNALNRLASALDSKLFEIPSALKLLEDLNIQFVDPATFGIADTPLKRENLIDFVLGVARMNCAHAANPARQRVLVSDGVELSESVRALMHDHFAAFSQIQDVNHFRAVFLRRRSGTSNTRGGPSNTNSDGRSLETILEAHAVNLANFFEELTRASVGLSSSGGGGNNTNRNNSDAAMMQRNAKMSRGATGGAIGVSCAQFVTLLHGLKLIAVKISGSTSSATGNALTGASSTTATAEAPAGIEEVRAVRIFLSCLPVDQSSSITISGAGRGATSPYSQQQELRLPQFIEALLRTALSWRERAVCRGRYDVCPGQMSSDVCTCRPDQVDYAFDVFRDAVQEVFARIHMYRLVRVQKCATMKIASIRSVRLPGLRTNARMSIPSTASGYDAKEVAGD